MANYTGLEVTSLDASALQGDLFEFLVGSSENCYKVHVEVINRVSRPLKEMVKNGKILEGISRRAKLCHIDQSTFVLFCQYAYTGMYDVQDPINVASPEKNQNCTFECLSCDSNYAFKETDIKANPKCPGCGDSLVKYHPGPRSLYATWGRKRPYCIPDNFACRAYPVGGMNEDQVTDFLEQRPVSDHTSENLIEHAKLFVFADQYMIECRQQLCLHKLRCDLCHFDLRIRTIDNLVDLLSYTYDNTPNDELSLDDDQKSLRDLVIKYTSCQIDEVYRFVAIRELLGKGGRLVTDLTKLLVERLRERTEIPDE